MAKSIKIIVLTLMALNGLLFISNIYTLGNPAAATHIHNDLAPSASALIINAKVIICFLVGILYLITVVAIILKKPQAKLAALLACILFDGLYIIELFMWGNTHPMVWFGFSLFGGLSLLFAIYSWRWSRHVGCNPNI